ncbi:MAG TPA: hypothetical protein VJB34_10360 [Bdellovibrionota bacterium]|nr:hypothetical protein [Bdellovibrionota bacterium]
MRRLLLTAIFLFPFFGEAYYGYRSTEAVLSFSAEVVGSLSSESTLELLNQEGLLHDEALELVRLQTQHLMGIFQSESFIKEFGYAGVLGEGEDNKIVFTGIDTEGEEGLKKLAYHFETRVVFDKRAFKRKKYEKAVVKVPLKLPLAPHLIYSQSLKVKKLPNGGDFIFFNPCTDKDFDREEYFWYFWDPDKRGCPLKNDHEKVLRINGKLERLRSTQTSYPEYDRLYCDNGNQENLDISIFIGYINEPESLVNADSEKKVKIRRRDEGYHAFQEIVDQLKLLDFTEIETKDAFRIYRDRNRDGKNKIVKGSNFLKTFERRAQTELGGDLNVRIKILLADTDAHSSDYTFHYYATPAMEQSDIFIYDGHSGLGMNLDLRHKDFQNVHFDPQKYQIFYFNGCSTYPYFGGMFPRAKGGTKNLEVITAGLQTSTETSFSNSVAFLNYFLDGKTRTYQQILENIDKSNYEDGSEEFTYLMGVSGDEDNLWTP